MFLMAEVLGITTRIDTYDENYLTALATLLLRVSPETLGKAATERLRRPRAYVVALLEE